MVSKALLCLSSLLWVSHAFLVPTTPRHHQLQAQRQGGEIDRREALGASAAALFGAALVLSRPTPAVAVPVGEGGLPPDAEAFSRIVKNQKQWATLGKTIATNKDKTSEEEWKSIQLYLRQAYNIGDDMKRLVTGKDNDKRNKGVQIAKTFQQIMVDLDKPCNVQDYEGFLKLHAQAAQLYSDYFELLSDVPDEL